LRTQRALAVGVSASIPPPDIPLAGWTFSPFYVHSGFFLKNKKKYKEGVK